MDERDSLTRTIEAEALQTAGFTGRPHLRPAVIAAMRTVRRDLFVPAASQKVAYRDVPLAIGHGQTISQPFIVAIMTDLLDAERGTAVLEIGTGSGYQTAILAELGCEVCTVEIIPALATRAAETLAAAGYRNVAFRTGDGAAGWPERAPFDRILVTAAARSVPTALVDQLRPGGRLVIPVGEPDGRQELRVIEKQEDGTITSRSVLDVAFVPLTGSSQAQTP